MKNPRWLFGLLLMGCSACASAGASEGRGEDIALSDVPAHVKQAALDALPGLVLTEAEKEVEDGVTIFSLTGRVAGKKHEVEVTSDGKVGEIDSEDADDEEEDEDEEEEEEEEEDD